MMKNVIKEIIIFLLFCLATILVFGILLYEYVPISKTIPNTVSYVAPESVKEELASSNSVDETQVIRTYEVDATDLNNYKNIQNYKPGKANPFSSYETVVENVEENANSTNTTSSSSATITGGSTNGTTTSKSDSGVNTNYQENGKEQSSSSTGNNENNTNASGGRFFQDKGTK